MAKLFVHSDHEVILMDEDESKLQQMESHFDLMIKKGCMTSLHDLSEADVSSADLFIAVPPYPDMSVLACILAKKLGAKTTISRVNTLEYLQPDKQQLFRQLGVDEIIYPEQLGAKEAVDSLKLVGVRQLFKSSDGNLVLALIKVRDNAPIIGKPFAEISSLRKENYNIVAINRGDETIIPHGNDCLLHEDLAYFVTTNENLEQVISDAGKEQHDVNNVMIIGGSRIGMQIARAIEHNYNVKLIEKDRETSEMLANELENTLVINGDARNLDLLREEGIEKMDALIAVSDNSEINILACQLAKKIGILKTVADVENLDYIPLAEGIGIGTLINKKLIAASYIYRYTLNAHVAYVKCLTSTNAEMLELVAQPDSKITRAKIKDLDLPKDMNIGGVVRGNETFIATGHTQIEPYDKVVIFAMQSSIKRIEKLFV